VMLLIPTWISCIREHKIVLRGPLWIFKIFHQKIVSEKVRFDLTRCNFHYS
jgi:hypothetical protein